MKRAVFIGMIAAAVLAGCTTGHEDGGPTAERDYQVGPFDRIEIAGSFDVDVRTGSEPSVHATGPEKSLERLQVEVDGTTLKVRPHKKSMFGTHWGRNDIVRLTVTVPTLSAAVIAGSGDLRVDRLSGENFAGEVAGSGNLKLGQVEVQRLRMAIAGSGKIRADSGRANEADYEIAGSGDLHTGTLMAEQAKVSVAGSGNVVAMASKTASIEILGSGNVNIKGGAKCQVHKAGSGNVSCS